MSLALHTIPYINLSDKSSRFEVTSALNNANSVGRRIKLLEDSIHPLILIAGLVTTVTAGSVLGAPFFFASAFMTVVALTATNQWKLNYLEDLANIRTYFLNRKPFQFSDGVQNEKVVERYEYGYSRFVLEQTKTNKV